MNIQKFNKLYNLAGGQCSFRCWLIEIFRVNGKNIGMKIEGMTPLRHPKKTKRWKSQKKLYEMRIKNDK